MTQRSQEPGRGWERLGKGFGFRGRLVDPEVPGAWETLGKAWERPGEDLEETWGSPGRALGEAWSPTPGEIGFGTRVLYYLEYL